MQKEGMKAIVYGCTGAIGSDLVEMLIASPVWSKVYCVARRQPEQWDKLPGKDKIVMEVQKDLDEYFKKENGHYEGVDTVFCCFGSQVGKGKETFVKVDYTYPLLAADIALKNKIPHYVLFSSTGGDPKSWFLYMKTKGEVERDLKLKKLNLLTILKPGLLKHRKDARTIQKIGTFLPFVGGIEAKGASLVCKILAEKDRQLSYTSKEAVKIYENKDMLNLL